MKSQYPFGVRGREGRLSQQVEPDVGGTVGLAR
jgi:hypothetical protein